VREQPRDQALDRRIERGIVPAHRRGEPAKPVAHRTFEVARLLKCALQLCGLRRHRIARVRNRAHSSATVRPTAS
jgi:hypothetical protein